MAIEIGSLLIDMRADVARLAQDMSKAQQTVDGAMAKVQRAASAATTALGLIGVGASVAGLAGIVRHAVDSMAALDDMAAAAGTTVENMSALVEVAKVGGHQIGIVETAMVRLTKALAGGDEEAKGAGKALATLGLNAEKLRGMDTAEALLEVANALDKYKDGGGKTALMLDLLGKSGAAAIPYLQDLAEKGRLNASVTADQAAAAERLQKDINAVGVEGEKLTRAMVAGWLPAMGDIAKAMRLAAEEGGTFKALFVGFGGLADQFVTPWKAAFLGLGAGLNEMLATFEEGLTKITFGGVAERHQKAALQHREAARQMNLEIAALARNAPAPGGGPEKPTLNYTNNKSSNGPGDKKTRLDTLLEQQQKRIAEINAHAGDEQMVSVDTVSRQIQTQEQEALEKLRKKYVDMADPLQKYREQLDEINRLREAGVISSDLAIEAEWAVNEAMDATLAKMGEIKDAGKDTFAELTRAIEGWGNRAADTLADFVVDGKASFSDLINSMLKDIVRLQAKQMLDPITKGASDWLGGALSKGFGGIFGGGSGESAPAWNPEWSFAGGGYTGDGARSGGLDGQGGFMAMLHPRESVIDHAAGQSSGGVSFNVTLNAPGADAGSVAGIQQQLVALQSWVVKTVPGIVSRQQLRNRITPMSA